MRLYLAGSEFIASYPKLKEYMISKLDNLYYLASFYYTKDRKALQSIIEQSNKDNFLLDSGAFTFIMKGINVNIDEYTQEYINFINKYDIKQFFEMDVDAALSYEKVKQLRNKIEKETGKKCIPVWHNNRGIEEFKRHCEEYKYIAFGSAEMTKSHDLMKKMTQYCNKKNIKIHLLGYNKSDILDIDPYSCDATSWNAGIYGGIWNWDNKKNIPIKTNRSIDKRVISNKQEELAMHNIKVWIHYQNYLKYKGYWKER